MVFALCMLQTTLASKTRTLPSLIKILNTKGFVNILCFILRIVVDAKNLYSSIGYLVFN